MPTAAEVGLAAPVDGSIGFESSATVATGWLFFEGVDTVVVGVIRAVECSSCSCYKSKVLDDEFGLQ